MERVYGIRRTDLRGGQMSHCLKRGDEARRAGELLRSFSIYPDISFTSLLKRAIVTRFLVMEELDRLWTPAYKDWRLNERHYGALQGLNKLETSEKYGAGAGSYLATGYDVRPPQVGTRISDIRLMMPVIRWFKKNCYLMVNRLKILFIECCLVGKSVFLPEAEKGKTILVAAHGNSLRALIMMLQNLSPKQIVDVEIPTGKPLILELGKKFNGYESILFGVK